MVHAYLTYFDINYAIKGVAMIESLQRYDPDSVIHVVCLDEATFKLLLKMALPGVQPVQLTLMEKGDAELARAKSNRSLVEYYWTLTPTLLMRFLKNMAPEQVLTYVDADMLFFHSPDVVYDEMAGKSVLIHKHNFPPAYAAFAVNGEFNVGLVAFRNDPEGIKVLDWWRERCLEWCYNRCEDGKMGDQKYLEHFSSLSDAVAVARDPGIGVAPWNFMGYQLAERDGHPTVDDHYAIFFHYHSAAYLAPGCLAPCTDLHYPCTTQMLRLFMVPYLKALDASFEKIRLFEASFAYGFQTEDLNTDMCILTVAEKAEDFREDFPCIVPIEPGYMACASPQYPEGLKACGPVIKAGGLSWVGDYPDWKSAEKSASGYDEQSILERVRQSAAQVRDGKALWERDSALFYEEQWNWPLLASLFQVAAMNDGKLHVLDFGGALGSTYMQHRRPLSTLKECVWHVVEQPHFVKVGQEEFANATLRFYSTIEEAMAQAPVNVILLSGVLQYLPNAYPMLGKILKTELPVIIERTPTLPDADRITVQHVPASIYKASYPCRWLNRKRLEWLFHKADYILSPWHQSDVDPQGFMGVTAFPKKKTTRIEVGGKLRVMQVDDFYGKYLDDFYKSKPGLGSSHSDVQDKALLEDAFSAIHVVVPYLDKNRYDISWFVPQAMPQQRAWALENGIKFPADGNWQQQMVKKRIENFRPDVLYLADPIVWDAKFLASLDWQPRLVLGWKAADLPYGIDLHGYDVILSGLSWLLEFVKTKGARSAEFFKPGMPQWLADKLARIPKTVDVCFAGSVSPSQHTGRIKMLDAVAQAASRHGFTLALYLNCNPALVTPAMEPYVQPPVFGLAMQKKLAAARIVLDDRAQHGIILPNGKKIEAESEDTINMRMFEATAGGSLLLTQKLENINNFFEPGKEIDVWENLEDLEAKILYWLKNDRQWEDVTQAGKLRCLTDHNMQNAADKFAEIITRNLKISS